jgi:hypothetical protein
MFSFKKSAIFLLILSAAFLPLATRADVGVSVYTPLLAGQNLFYGTAKGSNQGNLMVLQSRDGISEFVLDRNGNLWASSSVRTRSICNQDASYCFTPSSGGVDVTNDSWTQNGVEVYTSQNVGIGTNNPAYNLDVYGAFRNTSELQTRNIRIGTPTSNTGPLHVTNVGSSGIGSMMEIRGGSCTGMERPLTIKTTCTSASPDGFGTGINFAIADPNTTCGVTNLDCAYTLGSITVQKKEGSNTTGDMMFYTSKGGLTEKMRLTRDGNLGIGTNEPYYRVHSQDSSESSDSPAVYGVHSVTDGWGVGVRGTGRYMGVRGDVSTNYSGSVYGGYFSVYNGGGTGYGVYASGDEYGVYGSGSSYAGYFSGPGYVSGNFAVGSMSNNAKFQVSGRSLFNDGNANLDGQNLGFLANSAQMLVGWNRSSGQGEADFINNRGGGSQGGFSFYDINNSGGQTQLMRIRGDNGYVGIGTANPSYKLHVYSGSGETIAAYIDANSAYGVYAYGNTTAGWFSGNTYGVWGQGSTGVRGESPSGYGVWGNSSSGLGVYGSSASGWAGYFGGNVYVSGQLRVDSYAAGAGTYVCRNGTTFSTCSSLLKYKENVKDLDVGLDAVKKLRPVYFDWKDGEKADLGLIAEETAAVDSRLVTLMKMENWKA